jgi:hypothetical protein
MGHIINLRQARKARARADRQRLADSNRAKFGRTKAEKQAQSTEEGRQMRKMEGVRREDKDKATE